MKLEMIRMGRIVGVHGIRGELRVLPRISSPGSPPSTWTAAP